MNFCFSFNDCVPAVGVIFCDWKNDAQKTIIERMNQLQIEFRNSFAFLINCQVIDQEFIQFQSHLEKGLIRFYPIPDLSQAISICKELHENFLDQHKFILQSKIIEDSRNEYFQPNYLKELMISLLELCEISKHEANIFCRSFHSIAEILLAVKKYQRPSSPSFLEMNPDQLAIHHVLDRLSRVFQDLTPEELKEVADHHQASQEKQPK